MVGKYIDDMDHYINLKEEMVDYVTDLALKRTDRKVTTFINAADNCEKNSVFLTVTGTSAEMGDDGSVGRGNRSNGLITPNRPMSMEATSGKNPINHIGKIYNLLSTQMAKDIVKAVPDVDDVYIKLLSQIGKPIDQPFVASAQIIPADGANFNSIKSEVEVIMDDWLSDVTRITKMVINGELDTF
jgi:S-adenosylmethionine synthetase